MTAEEREQARQQRLEENEAKHTALLEQVIALEDVLAAAAQAGNPLANAIWESFCLREPEPSNFPDTPAARFLACVRDQSIPPRESPAN